MLLRQPLIVTFIAVGVVVGPTGLGLVSDADEVWPLLATIGIAVLLFVVGLRLDIDAIRRVGPVALFTGVGQVVFTAAIGFVLSIALGFDAVAALYIAVALTFSSTIIVVKLLSDKREIDSLHGRIAVGFLIVQDIVVVLVMIGLSAFGAGTGEANPLQEAGLVILKGAALLGGVALATRFLVPPVFSLMARSQELLVVSAIAWALVLSVVGEELGLSKEVGAFLAGVSLASSSFRDAISTRLVSLRDFLLLFFFVTLGAGLDLSQIGASVGAAVVLSVFVLIGNPIIVMAIMGAMGYRRRTGFLAGLTVAQISEFSLILAALGLSLGHIEEAEVGLITLVGLITIGLSTYMIMYSHRLYEWLAPSLRPFERQVPHPEERDERAIRQVDVIVFGLGRYGHNLADGLERRGLTVLGVDFDPRVVEAWAREGRPAHYGDAEDPEFPSALPLRSARWVVSTIPDLAANLALLRALRQHHGFDGRLAMTAHTFADAEVLQEAGVDRVLLPFVDAAERAAEVLAEAPEPSPAR